MVECTDLDIGDVVVSVGDAVPVEILPFPIFKPVSVAKRQSFAFSLRFYKVAFAAERIFAMIPETFSSVLSGCVGISTVRFRISSDLAH